MNTSDFIYEIKVKINNKKAASIISLFLYY